MQMQWRIAAAALSLGLLGSGCASISQVQTADTLGAGKFQVALEPGVRGAILRADTTGAAEDATGYLPQFDVAIRYGVTDHLDLGARVGTSLAELQGKYLFTNPENRTLAISLAPSVSGATIGSGDTSVGYVNLGIPLLVGFKTTGGSELVLGPRLDGTRYFGSSSGSSGSVNVLSAGASLGYALRVSEGFRLMPEVAVATPVYGNVTAGSDSTSGAITGGASIQFRLGFLFGQGRPSFSALAEGQDEVE